MAGLSGNNSINSAGKVNQNKFLVGLKKFDVQNDAELKSIFDKYNTDGDDSISQSEYDMYVKDMSENSDAEATTNSESTQSVETAETEATDAATAAETAQATETTETATAAETAQATETTETATATETAQEAETTETATAAETAQATETTETATAAETAQATETSEATTATESAQATETSEATTATETAQVAETTETATAAESAQATETTDATTSTETAQATETSEATTATETAQATEKTDATNTTENTNTTVHYKEDGKTVDYTEEKQGDVTTTKDADGRVTKKETEKGQGLKDTVEYEYAEGSNDPSKTTTTKYDGTVIVEENGKKTTTKKDGTVSVAENGVENTTYPDGSKAVTELNENGTAKKQVKTTADGQTHTAEYDENGNTKVVVQNGESISGLAKKFGVSEKSLKEANPDLVKGKNGKEWFNVGENIVVPRTVDADDKALQNRKSSEETKADYAKDEAVREQKREAARAKQAQQANIDNQLKDSMGLKNHVGQGNKITGKYKGGSTGEFTVVGEASNGRTIAKDKKGNYVAISHDGQVLKSQYVQDTAHGVSKKQNNANDTRAQQRETLNGLIKDHNAAQKSFDKQMADDGWAGDVADGVSALWGSDNRATKVRDDLQTSKDNINQLKTAYNQGEAQFNSKFKEIYGVDYNQKNIDNYKKNPTEENYKKAYGTKQKDINSRVENYNQSQQTGAAVVKTGAKIGAGIAVGVATGGAGFVAMGAAAAGTAAASLAIEETDRMKIGQAVSGGGIEFREGTDHGQILKDAAWDGAAVLAGGAVAKGASAMVKGTKVVNAAGKTTEVLTKGQKATKAGATLVGDVATGAAQEKLQTGEVTMTGTMMNAAMSGVGSAAESGLLKKGYEAVKGGMKKTANAVSDGVGNLKSKMSAGSVDADLSASSATSAADISSPKVEVTETPKAKVEEKPNAAVKNESEVKAEDPTVSAVKEENITEATEAAEIKAKQEADAKMAAEAEEAELKAKKEKEAAEAKAQEEAKIKAEEEKIKAEEEAKLKAQEEAKIKAEEEAAAAKAQEAKAKAEAEAKAKAEAEAKAKAEAEAKAKAEAEAKAKAEAEAKAKAEEEAKAKVEAEAKAKAEAEAKAAEVKKQEEIKAKEKANVSESTFKPVKSQEEAEQLYKSKIEDRWLGNATTEDGQPVYWNRGGEPWAYAMYNNGEPIQGTPWKMHLYADSPEEWGNVAQVAMPYMHEHKIGYKTVQDISPDEFQALRDTKTAGGTQSQQGKAFTLYFENEEQFLQAAKDLDARFAESGLKSSGRVANEGQIGDSGFISYRHEGADRGVQYKPDDVTDPYQAMIAKERASVKGENAAADVEVKGKAGEDIAVTDEAKIASDPDVEVVAIDDANAAMVDNAVEVQVVRTPQDAINDIAKVHPEQKAMLEQISHYPNVTAKEIENISVAMAKYPKHAQDIASVVKNRNIKTGTTLSGEPSPDMDVFVGLLEKHPDRKDDLVDFLSVQRKDINDTSNPLENAEDYLTVLDRHPNATQTVKNLAQNPNLGINDIDILTRMSHDSHNPANGEIIRALSDKKYTRDGIQKKLNTIEKYPQLKDVITSDAPAYTLIDNAPANTPVEVTNKRSGIRNNLEQNYAQDMQTLKTTLGDSFYDKVRWEEIIPANASEQEIKSILKELNDESKFFARLDINEYKYGKNAQWAYEMNRISKTAETRIANGEDFDNVISGIARDYRSYDEAGTLANNSVDAIYGGDRRVCSGIYRGIKDPSVSPSGCYVTEFNNKDAYSEYFDKFSKSAKRTRTAPYDDMRLTTVKMEGENSGNMVHPSKEVVDPAMKHVEERYNDLKPLFEKVQQGKQLTSEEIKFADQKIAESYYIMGNAMPWRRGSNGISDIYMRSCYQALGIEQPALRRGVSLDLESFCTDMDDYSKNWSNFFEERPAQNVAKSADNVNAKIENLEGEIGDIAYYDDDLFDNIQSKIDALPDDSKAKTHLQKELNRKIMSGLPTKEEYAMSTAGAAKEDVSVLDAIDDDVTVEVVPQKAQPAAKIVSLSASDKMALAQIGKDVQSAKTVALLEKAQKQLDSMPDCQQKTMLQKQLDKKMAEYNDLEVEVVSGNDAARAREISLEENNRIVAEYDAQVKMETKKLIKEVNKNKEAAKEELIDLAVSDGGDVVKDLIKASDLSPELKEELCQAIDIAQDAHSINSDIRAMNDLAYTEDPLDAAEIINDHSARRMEDMFADAAEVPENKFEPETEDFFSDDSYLADDADDMDNLDDAFDDLDLF